MTYSGGGSFQFVYNWKIHIAPQPANVPGSYYGSMVLTNSSFAGDNKTVPVTMNVTTLPIALDPGPVTVRLAQGAPPMSAPFTGVTLNNLGLGALTVTGVTASVASGCGNSWLTVTPTASGAALTFDPTGLQEGSCTATLTFSTNAVNTLAPVRVTMQVVPKDQPLINYQGVVDNATYTPGGTVAQGDIVVVKGEQFSFSATPNGISTPASASPMPASLSGVSVTVNDETAPLFYAFYGQIAFQMPWDIAPGTALVKVTNSNGLVSKLASVKVAVKAPGILLINGGPYPVITNAIDGSFPFAVGAFPGLTTHPVTAGDILTIWSIGLGPTSPAAVTGQAPPYPPLAWLTDMPSVAFSGDGGSFLVPPVYATPSFAGLSSQYPGLYQVNVTVPANCPTGTVSVSLLYADRTTSNAAPIAVQ
jgi:uncharacterized protein (TIGR03437 family)